MSWFHRGEGLVINFQTHCFLKCYGLWREPKRNSILFTKFGCFCKCHLLHLFRKITFIIFQVQSLFSLSVTLFFPYPAKESKPILWRFSPLLFYRIFHFALWKAAQELLVNWQFIQFYKAHFISTLTISKSFFWGGRGNLILLTIRMALFELKIPPREISLLRGNE